MSKSNKSAGEKIIAAAIGSGLMVCGATVVNELSEQPDKVKTAIQIRGAIAGAVVGAAFQSNKKDEE